MMKPTTDQGLITSKANMDKKEIKRRINNTSSTTFPHGQTVDNHAIQKGDVMLMRKLANVPSSQRLHHHANLLILSSFNGDEYGTNNAEMQSSLYTFAGVALDNQRFDGNKSMDGGMGVIVGGSTGITNRGSHFIPPGQYVMWEAPSKPRDRSMTGNDTREWRVGTARGRRTPVIKPYQERDVGGIIEAAWYLISQSPRSKVPGINGMHANELFNLKKANRGDKKGSNETTHMQDVAFAMRDCIPTQALLFMIGLIKRSETFDLMKSFFDGNAEDNDVKILVTRLVENLGIYSGNNPDALRDVLKFCFGDSTGLFGSRSDKRDVEDMLKKFNGNTIKVQSDSKNTGRVFFKMAKDSLALTTILLHRGDRGRRSRIIGRSQYAANSGDEIVIHLD